MFCHVPSSLDLLVVQAYPARIAQELQTPLCRELGIDSKGGER